MNCLQLAIPPLPQAITIGHSTWMPGNIHLERKFNVFDMIMVKKGRLFLAEENTEYTISEGQLLVLEPNKKHKGYLPCQEETEVYWLHFIHGGTVTSMDSKQIEWTKQLQIGTDSDTSPSEQFMYLPKYADVELTALIPHLKVMLQAQNSFTLSRALQMHAAMVQFFEKLQLSLQMNAASSKSYQISLQVEQYLKSIRTFSSVQMEQELQYNFDYLARCLKQHTGMSPLQYVHTLKMEEAKKLLIHTDLTIDQIAEQVGFENYNYFIRLFRTYNGKSPGKFRKLRRMLM